jgi:hypothetical protein
MHTQIFQKFIEEIRKTGNMWTVPQQRGANAFNVSIHEQNSTLGILVDQRVMPADPFFPIDIFFFVIRILQLAPSSELRRGDAMNCAVGDPGLEENTVEASVAIKFYGAHPGDYIFRRISVIANILVESGVCEHGRGLIRLRNLSSESKSLLPKVKSANKNSVKSKKTFVSILNTNNTFEPIPKYLVINSNRILSAPPQNINLITDRYTDKRFMEFPIMKEFNKLFPDLKNKSIQRKDVAELFRKRKYYLGFITAMIWGGINATRPEKKNEFETINFYKLLKQDEKKIYKIITNVKYYLVKDEYEKCFNYLLNEGKISGVGHAYFTKLMYFIGYNEKRIKLKPLIFDKWTSNAYLALLIDSGQFDKIRMFYTGKIDKNNKTVSLRRNKAFIYHSFIKDMNTWANELNISSSRLEEFIFGISLKENKSATNPRLQLWKKILNYFG